MVSVEELRLLAPDVLALIQQMNPFDTGNWTFNAIVLRYTPTGFKIVHEWYKAPYMEPQNEGWKTKSGKVVITDNFGIIDKQASTAAAYVTGRIAGNVNNMNINREILAKQAVDNPARQATLLKSLQYSLRGV